MHSHKHSGLRIFSKQYSDFKRSHLRSTPKTLNTPDESLDFYRQMFERNRAIKLVLDPDSGFIIDANPAASHFYGYSLQQLKTMHISDINTMSTAEIHDILQKAVAAKGANFQFKHRLASGDIRDVEVFAGILDFNNKTYLYEIIQDISERKRAERALRESEALYRLSAQNMPNTSVIMFDRDMRFTLAEGTFLKKFGNLFDNIIGKLPHEVLPLESQNFLIPIYQRVLGGEAFSYERTIDVMAYESYATPIYDDDGQIMGGMILSHDITETKRALTALQSSEERLRLIINNIEDLVTYNDNKGNFVYIGPTVEKMLGYQPEALLNTPSIALFHPEDHAAMIQIMTKAISAHVPEFTVDARMRHADGHYVEIESVGKLIANDEAVFVGGVFISRDVTERKRIQNLRVEKERLQTALEKEQELNNLRSRMMTRISHEFRTPLTVIQLATHSLAHLIDRLSPNQRAAKEQIITSQIQRLTRMLDEIHLVNDNAFSSEKVHRRPMELSDSCRHLCAQIERETDQPNKFALDLPEKMVISADPLVLKDAIYHVLHNAARFSDSSIPIHVSLTSDDKFVTVCIKDQGIGILPSDMPRIFEPFFRGTNIGESSGLGIGLTMARAAIEAHAGTINVESVIGEGTSVTIKIPMLDAATMN